jgi:thiosulfate/3-mercaptopyruvate sulfurtransferase
VLSAVRGGEACVVNALRSEQHRGTGGISYGRLGHIAGSVNVPAVSLVDAENRFKPVHELQRLLVATLEQPRVITYCGGGIAATSVAMLLMMLGHRDVRLYDGSLSEWAADPDLPMAVGE